MRSRARSCDVPSVKRAALRVPFGRAESRVRSARIGRALAGALSLMLASAGAAGAGHAPPWTAEGELPLPAGVVSARVKKSDQPLLSAPAHDASRRGSAARDAHLPIFAVRGGSGCAGRWLLVGPFAWVCEDAVELTASAPIRAEARTIRDAPDGLPFRYYFVGPDGSFAYKRLDDADVGEPDMQLEPGFAVAIVEERLVDGARYGRTYNALWVPMRDLGPVRSFAFRGEELPGGSAALAFAWVAVDKARVRSKTGAFAEPRATRARFELVPVQGALEGPSGKLVQIGDSAWLLGTDVRRPAETEPPPGVNLDAGERWIDVDLASQTLVAYEGRKPVFTTLVSTGKGRAGSPTATPKGTFRVWAKLLVSDMDNL
jgi:hypothetical protein